MSWSWIAAPIVGVVGVVTTYLAGWRQQKTTLTIATGQLEATAQAAREDRRQRRIEAAYTDMLTAMRRVYYWVFTVYPPMTQTEEEYTMPPIPELADPAASEALWSTYWSPRVEQLMDDWELAVRKLQLAGWTVGLARRPGPRGPGSIDEVKVVSELPDRKQGVVDAYKAVRAQVNLELRGDSDGAAVDVPAVQIAIATETPDKPG
jgi:hypothetical protein